MKRIMMTMGVALVGVVFLCVPAESRPEKKEQPTAQDVLVKSEVETAVSMLQALFAQHKQGAMSLEKAKELGADLLRELRYGADGYFWVSLDRGTERHPLPVNSNRSH